MRSLLVLIATFVSLLLSVYSAPTYVPFQYSTTKTATSSFLRYLSIRRFITLSLSSEVPLVSSRPFFFPASTSSSKFMVSIYVPSKVPTMFVRAFHRVSVSIACFDDATDESLQTDRWIEISRRAKFFQKQDKVRLGFITSSMEGFDSNHAIWSKISYEFNIDDVLRRRKMMACERVRIRIESFYKVGKWRVKEKQFLSVPLFLESRKALKTTPSQNWKEKWGAWRSINAKSRTNELQKKDKDPLLPRSSSVQVVRRKRVVSKLAQPVLHDSFRSYTIDTPSKTSEQDKPPILEQNYLKNDKVTPRESANNILKDAPRSPPISIPLNQVLQKRPAVEEEAGSPKPSNGFYELDTVSRLVSKLRQQHNESPPPPSPRLHLPSSSIFQRSLFDNSFPRHSSSPLPSTFSSQLSQSIESKFGQKFMMSDGLRNMIRPSSSESSASASSSSSGISGYNMHAISFSTKPTYGDLMKWPSTQ